MNPLYLSTTYLRDLDETLNVIRDISVLRGKTFFITGANGFFGSYLVDLLGRANATIGLDVKVYAASRSVKKLTERFDNSGFVGISFCHYESNERITSTGEIDIIIHAASNADPGAIIADPVGTITSNIQGTHNLLEWGASHGCTQFLYISSGEVYGQGICPADGYTEDFSGYVNPVQIRSCYPLSKRLAETLCVVYPHQMAEGLYTYIVRPSHTFGPTAKKTDSRAHAEFIRAAADKKDIVLRSGGQKRRSYTYISDAASALFTVLCNGHPFEAYNLTNPNSIATISEFAHIATSFGSGKLVNNSLSEMDSEFLTPIEHQVLSANKILALGWSARFTLAEGIERSVQIYREVEGIC